MPGAGPELVVSHNRHGCIVLSGLKRYNQTANTTNTSALKRPEPVPRTNLWQGPGRTQACSTLLVSSPAKGLSAGPARTSSVRLCWFCWPFGCVVSSIELGLGLRKEAKRGHVVVFDWPARMGGLVLVETPCFVRRTPPFSPSSPI